MESLSDNSPGKVHVYISSRWVRFKSTDLKESSEIEKDKGIYHSWNYDRKKIGSNYIWIWVAIESESKETLGISIS
jgi:transposase-like protein